MSTLTTNERPQAAKWGWIILLILSGLLALNGVILYFFIAESSEMASASVLEIGMGLLALLVVWEGFRQSSRWAWNATWVLIAILGVLGIQISIGGQLEVGLFYLALTAIGLVGQLLAGREFSG